MTKHDPDSGELLLLGHRGKGHDRTAAESRGPASRPWAVVRPVHQAIALLETLHATDLLFPTRLPGTGGRKSRMGTLTWGSNKTIRELQRLQDWVNSTFTPADGGVAIPRIRSSTCMRRASAAPSRSSSCAARAASLPPPCSTAISRRRSL